jgi:uncharacterized protein YfiM (DUF2279 family)
MNKLIILLLLLPTLSFAQLLTEKDKQMHFTAGVLTSAFTYDYVYRKTNNKKKAVVYSIASSIVVGSLKEFIDSRQKGNKFDTRDLLATTYGGISASFTINLFTKKKKSYPNKYIP